MLFDGEKFLILFCIANEVAEISWPTRPSNTSTVHTTMSNNQARNGSPAPELNRPTAKRSPSILVTDARSHQVKGARAPFAGHSFKSSNNANNSSINHHTALSSCNIKMLYWNDWPFGISTLTFRLTNYSAIQVIYLLVRVDSHRNLARVAIMIGIVRHRLHLPDSEPFKPRVKEEYKKYT